MLEPLPERYPPSYPAPEAESKEGTVSTPPAAACSPDHAPDPGIPSLGPEPMNIQCPYCHVDIVTATESKPGVLAWCLSALLCLVGLWPCVCIPCCIDSLRAVVHSCPSCKKTIGRYKCVV